MTVDLFTWPSLPAMLSGMGCPIAAAEILVLGASYREDVGDARYSGPELIVRRLTEMAAELRVHDPHVLRWWELEKQDEYPASSHSLKRFFRGQEKLKDLRVERDLKKALLGIEAVILVVRHKEYLNLDPDEVVESSGGPIAVTDCFGMLPDSKIKRYFELGCEVKRLGRGHEGEVGAPPLRGEEFIGNLGIGHTRWPTHGKPSETNAHPHKAGGVAVVPNGIIEN